MADLIDPSVFGFGLDAWDTPARLDAGPSSDAPRGPVQVTRPGAPGTVHVTASHWYASLIEGISPVGVAPVLIVAKPGVGVRNMLMFRNSGLTNLYIGFGNNPTTNSTLRIPPNQMISFPVVIPQNDINCISDAAGGQLSWSYSTTTE
jgi:hypothetical protein